MRHRLQTTDQEKKANDNTRMHTRTHVHLPVSRQVYLYISITHWTSAESEITN